MAKRYGLITLLAGDHAHRACPLATLMFVNLRFQHFFIAFWTFRAVIRRVSRATKAMHLKVWFRHDGEALGTLHAVNIYWLVDAANALTMSITTSPSTARLVETSRLDFFIFLVMVVSISLSC